MITELFEHEEKHFYTHTEDGEESVFEKFIGIKQRFFLNSESKGYCFHIKADEKKNIKISANYYVGVDWLIPGEKAVLVQPKINKEVVSKFVETTDAENAIDLSDNIQIDNSEVVELNILAMLTECLAYPEIARQTGELLHIDFEAKEIPIEQKQDYLSPFLIVQFLNLLQRIVRKGLKRSYYRVEENLANRVKGKILVGENIRQNVFKNRFTHTLCSYEIFGFNSVENKFLKKVFQFCTAYVDNHKELFGDQISAIQFMTKYCQPAFENIFSDIDERIIKAFKPNPFFKEYEEAIKFGKFILKRYSYNISKLSEEKLHTPPYWIDMPKLFELYVYSYLIKKYPGYKEVQYQFSTYGNALDFLLNSGNKMVIDAKYKLAYSSKVIHDDIRQVSGYARLNKVYEDLDITNNELIDCLIIFPDVNEGVSKEEFDVKNKKEIKVYRSVYKIGIKLPAQVFQN